MYILYFPTSSPFDYALQNVSTFFRHVGFVNVFSSIIFKLLHHFLKCWTTFSEMLQHLWEMMISTIFVRQYFQIVANFLEILKKIQLFYFYFLVLQVGSIPAGRRAGACGLPQGRSGSAPANTAGRSSGPASGRGGGPSRSHALHPRRPRGVGGWWR